LKTMNGWVEQRTQGKIKELVTGPLEASDVMFLINAVYFKAPWEKPFDPKQTLDGNFTAADGSTKKVSFMNREEDNLGYADDSIIAARLPYGSGRLEMVALLPLKQTLSDFVQKISPDKLNETIGLCKETPMSLSFPKFKLEYAQTLNDTLKAMGMGDAFGNADFTAMSKTLGKQIVISEVKHKSFIEVNEEGTEAAAATEIGMKMTAVMQSLTFDKPFLYLIRDSQTGAILFIGTMENPD
jgi:serine protease inhibitor